METGGTQSLHFWSHFDPTFLPEDSRNRKKINTFTFTKSFSHRTIQIFKNQGPISSSLSRKNMITFCSILTIFDKETGKNQKSKGRNQNFK